MQSNNVVVLACAGAGKTWGMCNDSICCGNNSKKVLMVSYTHKGVHSIKKEYAKQNLGVIDENVKVVTWFQFLLREFIKPYQKSFLNEISKIRSCDFSHTYGVDYSRKNSKGYFLTGKNDVKANNASEFAILLNKLSLGAVLRRLEETYSCIYIDELQDLVGKDIELLELLFLSSMKIYCVGDYRQATLKTHNPKSDRNRGGMNVFNYIETIMESHNLEIIRYNKSKRFVADIAHFANLLYPDDPIVSDFEANVPNMGVFQILEKDINEYINFIKPSILKYDIKTNTLGYLSLNFGVSKGMTMERVLIFPNGPLCRFLLEPSKGLKTPDKYYVGITRARYSLAFVVKNFRTNKYFIKDKIQTADGEIEVLRFII